MRHAGFMLAALVAAALPQAAMAEERAEPALSGEALFAAKCAACHGAAEWGTRALARRMDPEQARLDRRKVPAALVRYVVRYGINSMPQFTPTDLGDAELERVARWLETGE